MDSWRLNLIPGYWVPAYIYSEEGDFTAGAKNKIAFKAQTRMWGYNLKTGTPNDELTQIRVDSVKDDTPTAQDASPLAAEREWQQQAEDNVIERLERAGLLAPEGDVDKILQTVVNNLEITNNIELPRPVRTRVLTTSPLETFSVGNTIVVSRGLIDVLPDEGSLAMVLSHELAHIVLGHNLGSQYAFNDRMLFSDEGTLPEPRLQTHSRRGNSGRQESDRDAEGVAVRAETGDGRTVHQGSAVARSATDRAAAGAPRQQHHRKRHGDPHGGAGQLRLRRSTGTSSTRSPRCPWADASS